MWLQLSAGLRKLPSGSQGHRPVVFCWVMVSSSESSLLPIFSFTSSIASSVCLISWSEKECVSYYIDIPQNISLFCYLVD